MSEYHMRHALSLARRVQGVCAPNPSVGCVIVKQGHIVGRGWTQRGGRPHAETVALAMAGAQAKGADVYVTLEPCAHTGKTPPCAQGLINAQVARVFIGCKDPDARVSGRGIAMLQDEGIQVTAGVLEREARAVHAGFLSRIEHALPYITLKIATSADGKIAHTQGEQTRITGDISGKHTHLLRSRHDAILVGRGTVQADNPRLTTRITGYHHSITLVVLDSGLSLLETSQNTSLNSFDRTAPCIILYNAGAADPQSISIAQIQSIETIAAQGGENGLDLRDAMRKLAEQGINRVLVEGGAQVLTSFLAAGLWDEFYHYKAPHDIGEQGVDALAGHNIADAPTQFKMTHVKTCVLGADMLDIYTKTA